MKVWEVACAEEGSQVSCISDSNPLVFDLGILRCLRFLGDAVAPGGRRDPLPVGALRGSVNGGDARRRPLYRHGQDVCGYLQGNPRRVQGA